MGLLVGLALALLVFDEPWNWVAVGAGAAWEIGEAVLLIWWSKRRGAAVGAEALVGRLAVVSVDCMPTGQVRIVGELWGAFCEAGAGAGDEVIVREVNGLTLVVEALE